MKRSILSNGLTLLEVMIGLSIFAVAGIVALQSCLSATRHIQIINEKKNLLLLARIKTEEIRTGITDIKTEKAGVFPPPFERYQWELSLSDITISDTECGVRFTPYKLTVKTGSVEYSVLTSLFKVIKEGEENEDRI